jgi:hypothetical protein
MISGYRGAYVGTYISAANSSNLKCITINLTAKIQQQDTWLGFGFDFKKLGA